jgi:hypothetical protein
MRRNPPWPEGPGIFEAKDQRERILLARPDKVLHGAGAERLERKPVVRLHPSRLKFKADGEDEVEIITYGLPEGVEMRFTVAGQRGKVMGSRPIRVRSRVARPIVVMIDDPYVEAPRRSIVIEAEEADGR